MFTIKHFYAEFVSYLVSCAISRASPLLNGIAMLPQSFLEKKKMASLQDNKISTAGQATNRVQEETYFQPSNMNTENCCSLDLELQ